MTHQPTRCPFCPGKLVILTAYQGTWVMECRKCRVRVSIQVTVPDDDV